MTPPPNRDTTPTGGIPQHQVNRDWWDEVTPVHVRSELYDVPGFLKGEPRLDPLEARGLGDVTGRSVLHLQCHFGMSTIDIARRGAARVVGVDFSEESIRQARELAAQTNTSDRVSFVCCDVLEMDQHLQEPFDLVFATYGIITWISDLRRWAQVASQFVKPGGYLFLADIHPLAMLFDNDDEVRTVKYDYFHDPRGLEFAGERDYADSSYTAQSRTREWQWSLADVFRALKDAGLTICEFEEHPYSCYAHFPGMTKRDDGLWHLPEGTPRPPLLFSVLARRQDTS